ncbi:DsrE family protein [Halomicroarcula sp. GCM10025817]|uniref:DsrE family protein n=1 Tax=Haloarcula TaxID=2237 RepID=UPI0023E7B766|nr:DsrE family protein [Halomicroarcula sp. SYNS111]
MGALVHLTTDVEADRQHALRSTTVLQTNEELGLEEVALLLHRDAVWMVAPDGPDREWVVDLVDAGITVTLGRTCLDARDISYDAVPDGVDLVPSGVSEVVRRQQAGAAYVKIP